MKKIGLFTDVHGNIWALKAIFRCFQRLNCDSYIFCGDAVSMGSRSQECLDFLFSVPNLTMLLGNHDRDFVLDLARHAPMSHTPAEHKKYVFQSIDSEYRNKLKALPLKYTFTHGGKKFVFCHYALNQAVKGIEQYPFKQLITSPTAQSLAELFDDMSGDVYFFGHKHELCDFELNGKYYIDIGSLGCHPKAYAQGIVLTLCDDGSWQYQRVQEPYDRQALITDMTESDMPFSQDIIDFYFDKIHGTQGEKK